MRASAGSGPAGPPPGGAGRANNPNPSRASTANTVPVQIAPLSPRMPTTTPPSKEPTAIDAWNVALEAVSAAALRTQRAATRDPRLILAMKPGGDAGLLPGILAAYERQPEVLPVEVVFGA